MRYIKATLAMKMPKEKLKPEELEEIREGWEEIRDEMTRDAPEGVICELKVEEVEE